MRTNGMQGTRLGALTLWTLLAAGTLSAQQVPDRDFRPPVPRPAYGTAQGPVGGWLQGATLRVGRGRVAFFGEAAMFSAQVAGPQKIPMGMNAPQAEQNARFARAIPRDQW